MPVWEPVLASGLDAGLYSDRLIPPDETVRRLWPHLPDLGITRVARQTRLDRIGIPCWAAFRPNSKSLAAAQGKGLLDAAACASAIMEAAEVAVAEGPFRDEILASADELSQRGEPWFHPRRLLPEAAYFATAQSIHWLNGKDLRSGHTIWVPRDAVDMDGETSELKGICKTSNGLASGNSFDEALFHASCELIERDGSAMWSFLQDDAALAKAFSAGDLGDAAVNKLVAAVEAGGYRVTLFDQTTDIGVPVIMAVLGPADARGATHLEISAGYGAHPVAARAALRAITEAAQSRVTSIAASRDDIRAEEFQLAANDINLRMLSIAPQQRAPLGLAPGWALVDLVQSNLDALWRRDIDLIAVDLTRTGMPFSVCKVLSSVLEDRGANLNWHPGKRCLEALAV